MDQEKKGGHRSPWLRVLVHTAGLLPLVLAGIAALTGSLGYNPIQALERRFGLAAIIFLTATLVVSPLHNLTGWHNLLSRRQALGMYAFLYAALHFLVFAILDYGLDLAAIARLIVQKPFILLGTIAGLILLVLAITSLGFFKRHSGRIWRGVQRLVYTAGVLAAFHFIFARKGNLGTLSGDIWLPLAWGLFILLLLVLRLPPIYSRIRKRRTR